jgi:hypothetical protein
LEIKQLSAFEDGSFSRATQLQQTLFLWVGASAPTLRAC